MLRWWLRTKELGSFTIGSRRDAAHLSSLAAEDFGGSVDKHFTAKGRDHEQGKVKAPCHIRLMFLEAPTMQPFLVSVRSSLLTCSWSQASRRSG